MRRTLRSQAESDETRANCSGDSTAKDFGRRDTRASSGGCVSRSQDGLAANRPSIRDESIERSRTQGIVGVTIEGYGIKTPQISGRVRDLGLAAWGRDRRLMALFFRRSRSRPSGRKVQVGSDRCCPALFIGQFIVLGKAGWQDHLYRYRSGEKPSLELSSLTPRSRYYVERLFMLSTDDRCGAHLEHRLSDRADRSDRNTYSVHRTGAGW